MMVGLGTLCNVMMDTSVWPDTDDCLVIEREFPLCR